MTRGFFQSLQPNLRGAALVLALALGAAAGTASAKSVLVATPETDRALEPISEGYGAWLRHRLGEAGLEVSEAPAARGTEAVLAAASARGAVYTVIPSLREVSAGTEVSLRLYAPEAGELLAVTRAQAPLASFGEACEDTARRLFAHLGLAPAKDALPPRIDDLSASHRAVVERRAGNLGRAWREVQGRLAPTAMRLREEIVEQSRQTGGAAAERARVLASTGDAQEAWRLIAAELAAGSESPALLFAAGEVQLARQDPRGARAYFEMVLNRDPDHVDARRGLAQVFERQGTNAAAREAWTRVAELDSADPKPLVRLATLATEDDGERARLLIEAGRRSGARLDVDRASRYFARAAEAGAGAEAQRAAAELAARVGRYDEAISAYEEAIRAGTVDVAVHRGVGRTRRALGDTSGAEAAFQTALKLDDGDADSLRELGSLYGENGRAPEAVPLLERALEASPNDLRSRRSLARALRATGRADRALEVLEASGGETAESLQEIASIHEEEGRLEMARSAMLRAIDVSPFDGALHEQLSRVYESIGDAALAQRAIEYAQLLDGAIGSLDGLFEDGEPAAVTSFDDLVLPFATQVSGASRRRVAHLGLREGSSWRSRALHGLRPRRPAEAEIEAALGRAIGRRFELVKPRVSENPLLQKHIERLRVFDDPDSLDAETIATVNQTFDTHSVFTASWRWVEPDASVDADDLPLDPDLKPGDCAASEHVEIELRMLSGRHAEVVSILANSDCIGGDLAEHAEWNYVAFGAYAVALLLLLFPLVRGWGTLVVKLDLPPRTKGFFTIRITLNADKATRERKKRNRVTERLQRSLSTLSRYERRMAGRESIFRWIPARARSYTVTVKGPLVDITGDEIVGHFFEQKKVRIKRGKPAQLEYDFSPDECAVQVSALDAGEIAQGARVAIRDEAASFRYAANGNAFLYVGKGDYTILLGIADRVLVQTIQVRALDKPIPLPFDINDETRILFRGCPAAVDPYLHGDYAGSAAALEEGGDPVAANRVRAAHYERLGELQQAAESYEAAGELDKAAALRCDDSDYHGSARLFERAGEFAKAAEAYRFAGELAEAGRCYEAAYDYENALECYQEAGADDEVIDILEKTGEYLEAASQSMARGDEERAIHNLQQITAREGSYSEACKLFAELLVTRGDFELAADKYGEALDIAGGESAPLEMHVRHAELLERAGHKQRALEIYESIRRRDPGREDLAERTQALRQQLEMVSTRSQSETPASTRYERLEVIGRGGMGVVWKARDKRLGRMVALKQLPDNLRDHPEAVALFLREAQAAAALNHRNIVTLFDAGEEDGVYFITMELLEGRPLNAILKDRGRLGVKDTARLGLQIAAGLHYAQQQRIIHRDIKTANLFFTSDRIVKIMDFGLARTLDEMRRTSTVIGGTPYYMAPEQAAGEAVDQRADLYAFGVTLFQLATGTVPFREGDLAYQHRHTAPPDPREHVQMPAALAELILQLLEKDPADRCQSAGEAGRRLKAVLTGL